MSEEDESRKAILARRARYIAMALAGVSTATTACANACLRVRYDTGPNASADTSEPDAGNEDANR